MEDRQLNEKESLELISRMIRNTRKRMVTTGGSIFLVWGYVTAFVTLLIWGLLELGQAHWVMWLWWLIPIIGYPLTYRRIKEKNKLVITFIDKVVFYIWSVIGVVCVFIPIISMYSPLPVLFLECLLLNIGFIITALVLNAKSLIFGGVCGLLISVGLLALNTSVFQLPLFALMALVSMIIPGHVIRNRFNLNSKLD